MILKDCTCLLLSRVWYSVLCFVIDLFSSILGFACFDRSVGAVLFGAAVGGITVTFCVCCFGSALGYCTVGC